MTRRPTKRKAIAKLKKQAAISPYVVFISHSSYDLWIATVIAEKVEAVGALCWLDEKDLEGGDVIAADIIRGIDACHEAIVLISPNSVKSQWVAFEIGGVRAQHKRVTPILNNVNPEDMAPLKDVKAIELNKFEHFIAQLQKRIEQQSGNKR
jgi:hypothetical protein